uniref:Uncharacterized protein n=1 Tax=Clavaria fumosa TaxID=264083 RepID=A0A7T3PCS1_9AGAR|nr:hypothetical protein KQ422_mgp095 [Clavaria fumosa]QPZ51105.1 hypothetical protein [Clavaria fumosa]
MITKMVISNYNMSQHFFASKFWDKNTLDKNFYLLNFIYFNKTNNKYFHTTKINYIEDDFKILNDRISKLKDDVNIKIENNNDNNNDNFIDKDDNNKPSIILTDEQAEKLRDFNDFINTIKVNKDSDKNENVDKEISKYGLDSSELDSFSDSLHNSEEHNYDEKLEIWNIKRIVQEMDSNEEIKKIIRIEGLFQGIWKILKNPSILNKYQKTSILDKVKTKTNDVVSEENLKNNINDINNVNNELEELKEKYNNLSVKIEDYSVRLKELEDIKEKLDRGMELSQKAILFMLENKSNINMFMTASSIISPFLVYRGLLNSYTKGVDNILKSGRVTNLEEIKYLLNKRQKIVYKFNRLTVPFLATYYLYLGYNYKIFSTKTLFNTGILSSTSMWLFFNKKLPNGFFLLIFPILGYVIKLYIEPNIKKYFPSFYEKLLDFCSYYGYSLLTYPLIIWVIVLFIFYNIELYIYILYYLKNEVYIPKYIPKFTKNWLDNLKESASSKIKDWYLKFLVKNLFIHFIVILLLIYLFYN